MHAGATTPCTTHNPPLTPSRRSASILRAFDIVCFGHWIRYRERRRRSSSSTRSCSYMKFVMCLESHRCGRPGKLVYRSVHSGAGARRGFGLKLTYICTLNCGTNRKIERCSQALREKRNATEPYAQSRCSTCVLYFVPTQIPHTRSDLSPPSPPSSMLPLASRVMPAHSRPQLELGHWHPLPRLR